MARFASIRPPAPVQHPPRAAGSLNLWTGLAVLWLAGNSLRLTLLAVPPLLPAIHRDLHLDEKVVGALTGLPIFLLALAAIPGSLLVARLGARRALALGLVVVAAAGALRGAGPVAPILFAMTFLMGLGIAVSQPALPSLVKVWLPGHVGPATAAYSNGLLIGEIAAAALTAPLILPLVGGSWQLSFVAWSVPVAATAIVVLLFTPHVPRDRAAPPRRWWPDWRSARTWRLGLIMGCASTAYFNANAFIPDYLKATHHAQLITAALTALNLLQLPSSFLVAALSRRLIGRRWPAVAAGALILASVSGFVGLSGGWIIAAAGLWGLSSSLMFIVSLALPPFLTDADDVHRLSAAMFTISYACASLTGLVAGAIWDATGVPATAFTLVFIAGPMMIVLALGLNLPRPGRGPVHSPDAMPVHSPDAMEESQSWHSPSFK